MITPSSAMVPPVPLASPREASGVWARFGRWSAEKGWIHALLLVGVAVCLYPLVWMFMMSVKTDEEIGDDALFPSIPVFRDHSPYVRDGSEIVRPSDVDVARFATALPALREITTSLVLASM